MARAARALMGLHRHSDFSRGKRTTFAYDDAGRQTLVIDPLLNASVTVYDHDSRMVRQINPLLQSTFYAYDAANRKIGMVDGNGKLTEYRYDFANRPVVSINANGGRVTTIYDNGGRTIGVVNENSQLTQTRYDKADRRTVTINPYDQRHTYAYDAAGNQRRRIDARRQLTTYVYDANNREIQRYYNDATQVEFQYDENGNRTLLSDWTGRYTYSYDPLNRVEQAIDAGVPSLGVAPSTLAYDYDAVGNRKRMYDPDGGIYTTLYDAAHQLRTVTNPNAETTSLDYDDAGQNTLKELDNGTSAQMVYDAAGHQEEVLNLDDTSVTISHFVFGFDGVGNRTSSDEPGVQYSNWTYDGQNQLGTDLYFAAWGWARLTLPQWKWMTVADWGALPVDVLGLYLFDYQYDPAGNRLTQTNVDTSDVVTNTYDDANRLRTSESVSGITTYTYDENGNTLTVEEPNNDITTNTWDCENRLVQVEHPSSDVTNYTYNADGLRVTKDDNAGAFTKLIYDGNNALREVDDTGLVHADFTYDPQPFAQVLSQLRDGDSSFYHFDGIKSTSELTDDTGMVTDEYTLDAFGKIVGISGPTGNPQIYKGEYRAYQVDPDAGIDSIFTLSRSFDVLNSRFLSEDPAEKDLNTYRVCGNNPVNEVDPSGREKLKKQPLEAKRPVLKTKDLQARLGSDPQHISDVVAKSLTREGLATGQYHTNEYGKLTELLLIPVQDEDGTTKTVILNLNVYTLRFWKEPDWSVKGEVRLSVDAAKEQLKAERRKNLDDFMRLHRSIATIEFALPSAVLTAGPLIAGGTGLEVTASALGTSSALSDVYRGASTIVTNTDQEGGITQGTSAALQLFMLKETSDNVGRWMEFGVAAGAVVTGVASAFQGPKGTTAPNNARSPVSRNLPETVELPPSSSAPKRAAPKLPASATATTPKPSAQADLKSATIDTGPGRPKMFEFDTETVEGVVAPSKPLAGSVVDSIPSVRDAEFNRWFNKLTPNELDEIWKNPKLRDAIEDRLRHPGGLHEWHLVARTPTFKRWGLTADQIKEMRSLIKDTEFVNPVGRHGGKGSTVAHNELLEIIDSSTNYEQFVRRLQNWANYRLKGGVDALPSGLRPQ